MNIKRDINKTTKKRENERKMSDIEGIEVITFKKMTRVEREIVDTYVEIKRVIEIKYMREEYEMYEDIRSCGPSLQLSFGRADAKSSACPRALRRGQDTSP